MDRMTAVAPRPYRLHNRIMDYAWGTRDDDAFIPRLLGTVPEPGVPYAELWVGAHPRAPSEIELGGGRVPLNVAIAQAPQAFLGPQVATRFEGKLPFLFKVLSAGQALSIQAHPNKAQAIALHARDPQHYPDDNHKPEVAVALGDVRALAGFRPVAEMVTIVEGCPELAALLAHARVCCLRDAVGTSPEAQAREVRRVFLHLLDRSLSRPGELAGALDRMEERLCVSATRSAAEALFLELRAQYPGADVGLLAPFLMNMVHLSPGQGLYTAAGVAHAYLGGDLVECMANSDNVVRVGLTPKFRDARALAEILDATPGRPTVLEGQREAERQVYPTPAAEFEVSRVVVKAGNALVRDTDGSPETMIVIRGGVSLRWETGEERYARGQSALIPACLAHYVVWAEMDAEWFMATVPG